MRERVEDDEDDSTPSGEAFPGSPGEAYSGSAGEAYAISAERSSPVGDALWIGALRDEIVRAARARAPLSLLLVELDDADRLFAAEPRVQASATFGRFAQVGADGASVTATCSRARPRAGPGLSRATPGVPAPRRSGRGSSWRCRRRSPGAGAPLTVSVGLAVLGEDGHNAASLIDAAEQTRFAAEASGIGIVTDTARRGWQ